MADESTGTAPAGLPSSVEETQPDMGSLFSDDGNQSTMRDLENELLYGTPEDVAPESDAADDTSTPPEEAAPVDESGSDEPEGEEPAEEEAADAEQSDEEEEEAPPEETPEERLARLEKENAELAKRVANASRKTTFGSQKADEKVAQLEAELQRLQAQKAEAERMANLKPYHAGHPEHAAYEEKKVKVDAWNRLRARFTDSEEDREKVDAALIDLGLTSDDIRLVQEGRTYEGEQARRWAVDPDYRRQALRNDMQAVLAEQTAHQQQLEHSRQLLEDPENKRLMTDVYPEDFNNLWNDGHGLDFIFERLHTMELRAKLEEATAAKNRVKASTKAKSDLAKRKAATATETKPAPPDGPLWASELADIAAEEYEKQTGRRFVPDRRDCQEFFNDYCQGKQINIEERK